MPTKQALAAEYIDRFKHAVIQDRWKAVAKSEAATALGLKKDFYSPAERATKVPWFVIAALNMREQSQKTTGSLLNGDDWHSKTHHYPPGYGPWHSWAEAAVFAIQHEAKGWNINLDTYVWDLPGIFWYLESYNGFGHRQSSLTTPPNTSPYVYSGTQFYVKGKRREVPDGRGGYKGILDEDLVDGQLGVMALIKQLHEMGEVRL